MNRVYRFVETTLAVDSDEPSILDWLDEFMAPAFEVLAPRSPASLRVGIRSSAAACEAIRASRPPGHLPAKACFALDQGIVCHPHWLAGRRLIMEDRTFGAFYAVDGEAVEVTIEPQASKRRGGAMRVIRELATAAALLDEAHFLLHAAGFESRGSGVLLAGPKGVGKTTALAYLASSTGSRILTNDRALLCLDGGTIVARGVPTVVSIRGGTVELLGQTSLARLRDVANPAYRMLAELRGCDRAAPSAAPAPTEPLKLSPAQLADAIGVGLAPRTVLAAIVFPERAPDERSFTLARLSPDEAEGRLRDSRFGVASGKAAPTAFEELVGTKHRMDEDAARCADLAARIACFRLLIGASSFADAATGAEIVRRLFAEA